MDMAEVPVEALLSKEYAAENFNELKPYASTYDAGEISAGETIYLTVADKDGNMISLIQSNYRGMGSSWFLQDFFMLQDRGELFTLRKGSITLMNRVNAHSTPLFRHSSQKMARH